MTRKFLIVTALVAGTAAAADAQICAGTAPFTAGNMRVGASVDLPDGGKIMGGEFAKGLSNGAYLAGSVARSSVDDTDINWMELGANGGYEMSFASMPKIRVCPTASLSYGTGPDFADVNVSTINYSLGGAVGGVLSASENLAIVPAAHLRWLGTRATAEQNGTSASASDSYLRATLSAGFVFNRAITVAPVVHIPLGEEGMESTFGFAASYNFGRSGGVAQQGGKKTRKR